MDPIDAITELGWRVLWVDALDQELLLIESERIALVDASLSRTEAADLLLIEI